MVRILVVDDQKVIRQGLKALLEAEPDLQVVDVAENGAVALEIIKHLQPDVALIDLYMPVMDGVTATRMISQHFSHTKVLLLSGSNHDESIAAALEAGAMGYLLKDTSAEDLANAIRSVHKGYSQLGPGLLSKLISRQPSSQAIATVPSTQCTHLETALLALLNHPALMNTKKLGQFMDLVKSPEAVPFLLTRIDQILAEQPDNFVGQYIAGTLRHRFQAQEHRAIQHWSVGFNQGFNRGLTLEGLLLFCDAAHPIAPEQVTSWLSQLLQACSSSGSLSSLVETAAQCFGTYSWCYRVLTSLWQIKRMNSLIDDINSLKTKLVHVTYSRR